MAAAGDEESLEDLIGDLPPDLRAEVEDFVRFLRDRRLGGSDRRLTLTWAGGLREFRDEFTALELEEKALDWWGG